MPAKGMDITKASREVNPPRNVPANIATRTAAILFQLYFVIRKFVSRRARITAGNSPTLWQMTEMLMALKPWLSLAPLSTSICVSTDRMATSMRMMKVDKPEMTDRVLLVIYFLS